MANGSFLNRIRKDIFQNVADFIKKYTNAKTSYKKHFYVPFMFSPQIALILSYLITYSFFNAVYACWRII